MRYSHPYAWVLLLAMAVLGGVAIVLLKIARVVTTRLRAERWERERVERKTWNRISASVEKAVRVTEAGAVSFVLRLEEGSESYRHAAASRHLKRIVHLGADIADAVEGVTTLPVRVHPAKPNVVALDFDALLGEGTEADAAAREDYLRNGATVWTS